MLSVGGGYVWYSNRGPSKTDQIAIKGLIREFETHMEAGEYFDPASSNAAKVLLDMREINRNSKALASRIVQLAKALNKKADELAKAGDVDGAQKLFERALASELFADDALAEAQRSISQARGKIENAEVIKSLIANIEAKLNAPGSTLDVGADFVALRSKLDAADPAIVRLEKLADAKFAGRTQKALDDAQLETAQSLLVNWRGAVPNSSLSGTFAGELAKMRERQGFAELVGALRVSLADSAIDTGKLGAIAENIRSLQKRKADAPEVRELTQQLVDKLNRLAQAAIAAGNFDQATALVNSIGAGFEASTTALVGQIEQSRKQAQIAQLSGILLIDSQPVATVLSIVDSKNQKVALSKPS
ncbi:hypothetical protein HC761_00935, partial [bacterium]|nr:hypothetical protein [bacterium]